jgi:subtilisin-like proprotein convertase family protein
VLFRSALATFSNVGATTVDLGAPGDSVLSTVPGNSYAVFSGTSMATPHVSGAAALALALAPSLSTAQLKELLLTTGDLKPALSGTTLSGRRLNIANLLEEVGPPVPHFNMGVSPTSRAINQGDATSYALELTAVAGFTGDAALTVTSVPAFNGTLTLTPTTVGVPGTSTLAVTTTQATAVGTYTFTITGESGALSKSRSVSLRVRPFGTVEVDFPSTDTPLVIPGNSTADFDNVLHVGQAIDIQSITVDLNVTHTWIGDLRITLTSPEGTEVVLHDLSGGSSDNIHQTYSFPAEFFGEQAQGDWVLNVVDVFPADGGTLDDWTLHILGTPTAPTFGVTGPAALSLVQGETATASIAVTSINGFAAPVALSAITPPGLGATLSFAPATVTAPGASTLTIAAGCGAAPGTYPITLVGQSGTVTRTAQLSLTVLPFGTTVISRPSTDTPRPIPDGTSAGIISTVNIAEGLPITALSVEVDITHPFTGDLQVELIGPGGQVVLLHSFGNGTNLHQTYVVPAFNGQPMAGTWSLRVSDFFLFFAGTLDGWTLNATGVAPPAPPTAAFSFSKIGRAHD